MIKAVGKSFEGLARRVRPHLSPAYRRAFDQMVSRRLTQHKEGEPFVVCDFANPAIDSVGGRYYASMILDFIAAGYFPVFTAHRATLSSFVMSGKKSLILGERLGVIRSAEDMREPFFLITDRSTPPPTLATRVVKVDYEYRLARGENEMELPFFVHPQIGINVELPHPYDLGETRNTRIFFGGNTKEHRYSKDVLGDHYNVLNRREMLAAATAAAVSNIYKPEDAEKWLASDEFHPFVMFESQRNKIPWNRWIDGLAKSDFFLACPGVGMPLCHNLIESLAAGTIPILQYGHYLPQPLEGGVNCLAFEDVDDLRKTVKSALKLSQDHIRELRGGVRDYYERYLAPGRFAQSLFAGEQTRKTLLMNAYRVPRK